MAERIAFITTVESTPRQRRFVLVVLIITVTIFFVSAPFAKKPLPELWSLVPANHTALVLVALITALLLFGQVRILGSGPILLLACGYLFSACMAAFHAMSVSGPFARPVTPSVTDQASEWIYFLWQGGFAVWVIFYGLMGTKERKTKLALARMNAMVLPASLATVTLAVFLTVFTLAVAPVLPKLINGGEAASMRVDVAIATWLCGVAALAILWTHRPRTLLDIWLLVIICAWICDTALSTVLSQARFDVGWYAGRLCGLFADSLLLIMLLYENSLLYARLVVAHARERRLSEEKLRASETRFDFVFEQAAVGVAFVTIEGRWLRVNRRLCDILGYTSAELTQHTVQDIVNQRNAGGELDALRKVIALKRPAYTGEARCMRKDGRAIWAHLTVVLTRDPAGRPDSFIFVIEDIQPRKEAEKALRRSEQRFRTVFDQATVAIYILDKESGAILDANRLALAAHGCETLLELQHQDIGLAWPGSPELALERIAAAAAGAEQHFEIKRTDHEGRVSWGDVLLTKVHLDGMDRLLAVISDVTERKMLEQEVIRTSTAEQARVGREIHDGISQQLTGLSLLLGNLHRRLLKNNLSAEAAAAAEVSTYLQSTLAEARRLASGLVPVEISSDGLAVALEHLANQVSRTSQIDCRYEGSGDTQVNTTESATQLFRIAQEAVQNAVKHAHARHILIMLRRTNGRLLLSVRDDGKGIDQKSNRGGGLGLHTMNYRASTIGGRLNIESSKDGGTVVHCIMPI